MVENNNSTTLDSKQLMAGVDISFLEGIQQFEPQYVNEYMEYCVARELDLNDDSAMEFLEMKYEMMMEDMFN